MKKVRTVLATAVLFALQHQAYAEGYDNQELIEGQDISLDSIEIGYRSPDDIYIGNKDGSSQSITIGNESLGKYDYAIQINEPFTAGVSPHNLTFNADTLKVIAGSGNGITIGTSYEDPGYSSLTFFGKNFDYQGSGVGGIYVEHGKAIFGQYGQYLDNFSIFNGAFFNGVQPSFEEVNTKIYSHNINIVNNAEGQGIAFEGSGIAELYADNIYLKGAIAQGESLKSDSGVLTIGSGSKNIFSAQNIVIEVENGGERLYAVKSTGSARDDAYSLNLKAENILNVKGNILLDSKGESHFSAQDIIIFSAMEGDSNSSSKLGAAIAVNNASKLYIGSTDNKVNSLKIDSNGLYGILLGGPKDGINRNENGYLEAHILGDFNLTSTKGSGIAALRDWSSANIYAGSTSISAKDTAVVAKDGKILISNNNKIEIISSDGNALECSGDSFDSNRTGNITISSLQDNIYLEASNNVIDASINSLIDITSGTGKKVTLVSKSQSAKAAVYASAGYIDKDDTVLPQVNLNANNGLVEIFANGKAVHADGIGGIINIDGAVNIDANYKQELVNKSAIAIVAGAAIYKKEMKDKLGEVNLILSGKQDSFINGDIVAARNGKVMIKPAESYQGSLNIVGDILAGRGGNSRRVWCYRS